MAFTYSEFQTTPAGVIAAVKAAILVSSNWSNPTGQVVQCTAQNGATMALDLVGGGAADNQRIRTMAYRLFSGGVGTNGVQRSLYWNRVGNITTSILRCKVAAGNTLLYIEIEGPRPGEPSADNASFGSFRQCLYLAQVTPYLGADTIPVVAFGGSSSYHGSEAVAASFQASPVIYVSRNQGDTVPWVAARLATLVTPIWPQAAQQVYNQRQLASDGTLYLAPYVVFEDSTGIRGRLTDLFFAGWKGSDDGTVSGNTADGMPVSYGGNTYKITAPWKTDGSDTSYNFGAFASVHNKNSATWDRSPLIAVRSV